MNYVQTSSFQAKAKICDMVSFLQKKIIKGSLVQKEVLNAQRGSNVIVYLFQWGSACRSKGTVRKSSKAPISETFKCVKEGQLRHPMHFWIIKFGVFATDHFEM